MINLFGLQLDIPGVGVVQFIATIAIMAMVVFFYGLYLVIYVWKFGEPMRKYLKSRLTPNTGIIQIYEHEGVELHLAHTNNGEFTDLENKGYAKTEKIKRSNKIPFVGIAIGILLGVISGIVFGILSGVILGILLSVLLYLIVEHFFGSYEKITFLKPKPIVSKSTVSINGVDTLLAWNVNPKLPDRYTATLEELVKLGYNTLQEITDCLNAEKIKRTDVVNGMSIDEFLVLHEKVRNRNSISVTSDDVLNFEKKYLDEHPRKSIVEKIVSKEQQRITDKKYQTYAFLLIALMIVGGFIMLAWKLHNGAK